MMPTPDLTTERAYREYKAKSWTRWLKPFILKSEAHAQFSITHGGISTPSRAFLNAIHCLALRPGDFDSDFAVLPEDFDRGTLKRAVALYEEDRAPGMMPTDLDEKSAAWLLAHGHVTGPEDFVITDEHRGRSKYKAIAAALPVGRHTIKPKLLEAAIARAEAMKIAASIGDRLIITDKEHARAQHIAAAVRAHPKVKALLAHPECLTEQSLLWTDPVVGESKGRADICIPGVITADLKSYRSDDPKTVARDICGNAWDSQLAWYEEGVAGHFDVDMTDAARVTIIAVEHGGDYGARDDVPALVTVGWFEHSDAMRKVGDAKLKDAKLALACCLATGEWAQPTPADGVVVDPPRWAVIDAGLDPEDVFAPSITITPLPDLDNTDDQ